ncbi:MAG: hypothetical protein KDE54_18745 [Caldilineaceae bacterium]|nr:hypothetical protein [Caldilineaceae bacterium]MCB0140032.1 hypothetical protein [Caldilineaceae bacterium]
MTEERWHHITEAINHPDMIHFMAELQETIRPGQRKQDPLNPQKYRYSRAFTVLDDNNSHIVAIVLCQFREGKDGHPEPNNYIVTAYQKEIG